MTETNDWLQLANTWQAQAVDLPALRRRTRWYTARMVALISLEIAIVLMIWTLAIYWRWFQPLPTLWQVWTWLWAVLAPVMTYFNLRARRGTWRAQQDSVHGLLELRIRRANANLKTIRYGTIFSPAGMVLGWIWNGLTVWQYGGDGPWWLLYSGALMVTLIIGGWLLVIGHYARRERRTLAVTESLLQDLG